jgi:hypothetical protein
MKKGEPAFWLPASCYGSEASEQKEMHDRIKQLNEKAGFEKYEGTPIYKN